jgi:DNA end-binding protein Ku
MARTIWKGSLSFGLVNVPIGLYPATQDKAIHFNQLEEGTSDRIRYKKVNERTGTEVEAGRIVKGVDIGGGEYVILTDEELAAAEPQRSRLVEITDFVDLEDIDPVYFRSTYYLAPEGEAGGKAYALLRQAMRDSNRVAIGTLVMRNKEYPVAIRPDDEVLKLETMYFADEIRSPGKELPDLPDAGDLTDREVSMAKLLIESMESTWDPDRYHDTHRQKVQELVEAKRQGDEIVVGTTERPETKVVDLMEVLSASIASVKGEGKASPRGRSGTASKRKATVKSVKPAKKAAPSRRAASAKAAAGIDSDTEAKAPSRRKAS